MTNEQKMDVALHRYGIIAEFVNGRLIPGAEKARRIKTLASRKWNIPHSAKTRISQSSIRRWFRVYKSGGCKLEALQPKDRKDIGISRAMDADTCNALEVLRKEMPDATVFSLIRQMEARKLVTPGIKLAPSTVYRFLHARNQMGKKAHAPEDRRKFEAELPNDLWQSDVMHGPKVKVRDRMRKTYLIGIIDDHSRLITHAEFCLSENLATFLSVLEKGLQKRGLPRKFYVDNGPAYRSKKLEYVTASLNIALIHARPYKPQGKGKIERWHRTVRSSFLPEFKGETLEELNLAFTSWLKSYCERKHGATGQTPFKRFTANMSCLRPAPENLRDYFRTIALRRIAKDRTITLNGKLYEGPVNLIGKRVEVLFHEDDEKVEIRYKQQSFGFAAPVDLHVNCRVKRDRNSNAQLDTADHTTGKYRSGALFPGKEV